MGTAACPTRRTAARLALATCLLGLIGVSCGRDRGTAGSSSVPRPSGWPGELKFALGMSPNDNDAVLLNAPFARRIEQATGLPVTFFTGTSFSSVVEAMRAKRIDGMQIGVFSYLLAEKEAGAEAIAVYVSSYVDPPIYDDRLRPEYNGLIVAKKGNGVRTLADLKGRTLNFGDPAGTSDHLVPKTELLKVGLVPGRDLKTTFAGNHASALVSLWNDKADAAATAEPAVHRFQTNGQFEYCGFPDAEVGRPHSAAALEALFDACPDGRLVPIFSVQIPGTPFALCGDLPADLKDIIRSSLLSTAQDPQFIHDARRWYVDPSVYLKLPDIFAYYDSMRDMAKLLDLDLTRLH